MLDDQPEIPMAMAHHFGDDLRCLNSGCKETWQKHRTQAECCMGSETTSGRRDSGVRKGGFDDHAALSHRVLVLRVAGLTYRDIADELGISTATISQIVKEGQ